LKTKRFQRDTGADRIPMAFNNDTRRMLRAMIARFISSGISGNMIFFSIYDPCLAAAFSS
jgi:hypothetical protein